MRKPLIAANWKMNGSLADNEKRLASLLEIVTDLKKKDVVIFPPAIYIPQVANLLYNSDIAWGFQNVFYEVSGAYTGEHSPLMAKDYGVTYALVGHSERRVLFGETDEQIFKKISCFLSSGLIPILCIGETLEQYEQKKTNETLKAQLHAVFQHDPELKQEFIIAYEPVWAIGSGRAATETEVQSVHADIRQIMKEQYPKWYSKSMRIIYGGSVTPSNSESFLSQPDIDGLLVGGASLKASDFISICTGKG